MSEREQRQRELVEARASEFARREIALRNLLALEDFREWVAELIDICGVNHATAYGNSKDMLATGRRDVGCRVMKQLRRVAPELAADVWSRTTILTTDEERNIHVR